MRKFLLLLPLPIILLIIYFSGDLARILFNEFEKPKLISVGYSTPLSLNNFQRARTPKWAVLAKFDVGEGAVTESFVDSQGNSLTSRYENDALTSKSVECKTANQRFWIFVLGLLLFTTGGVLAFVKSGVWNWLLRFSTLTTMEKLLIIYGGSIAIIATVAPTVSCTF